MRLTDPRTAWLLGVLVALAPGPAGGSGFYMAKFGGDLGYPTSPGAVAVFWNPAAMGLEPGTSILLENAFIHRRIDYERVLPDTDAPENVGRGRLRNWVFLPYVGAKSDFGLPVVTFGAAAYPVYGMKTAWSPQDGPQRWHSIDGNLVAWYVTGAVAVRLPWHLSLGVSVSYVRTTIETLRATSLATSLDPATGDLQVRYTDDPRSEGRTLVDVADHGVAYAFGVLWTPTPAVRTGLSYQSRVRANATGRVRIADPRGNVTDRSGSLAQTFPDSVHWAVEVSPTDRLGLRLGVSWVHWSLFDEQVLRVEDALGPGRPVVFRLPRSYHDAWIVRGGFKVRVWHWLTVYAGAGWDQSPVPPETLEASLYDGDKVGMSLGAVLVPWEHLRLTVGYNHVYYSTQEVARSRQQPSANGRYDGAVDIVHTNAEFVF